MIDVIKKDVNILLLTSNVTLFEIEIPNFLSMNLRSSVTQWKSKKEFSKEKIGDKNETCIIIRWLRKTPMATLE